MSRIGRKPIPIPKGVEIKVDGSVVSAKGTKGALTLTFPTEVHIAVDGPSVKCTVDEQTKETKSKWGLSRMLIANMLTGVSEGYRKDLEIVGVGYRAEMKGKNLAIAVGYSSPVEVIPESGIEFSIDGPTKIAVKGPNKESVGRTAAAIRRIRPPEPYNGKGIRYAGEHIVRKAGKAAGK